MLATKDIIDTLNSLLRVEISATETYAQALHTFQNDACEPQLRLIRDDHRTAANAWRQHIHQFGGEPAQSSGLWGVFAKATQGVAKVFGKTSALTTLKEGEQQGLNAYEKALQDEELPMECQSLIRTLIPQAQENIRVLDGLMTQEQ